MQGEESLITVECLRGRLLAERAASKIAKENADIMDKKLRELEKQLKVEMKYRRKAEKKLKLLKDKLETLNIPFSVVSGESEHSSSSANSETSCISSISSNTCLSNNNRVEEPLPKSAGTSISSSINSKSNANVEDNLDQDIRIAEQRDVCIAYDRQPTKSNQDGLRAKTFDKLKIDGNQSIEDKFDHAGNSMALVLVECPIEFTNPDYGQQLNSDKVREVLDTLKHVRENIQIILQKKR